MDNQKRKRADSTEDFIVVQTAADIAVNPNINDEVDDIRFGLPSNTADNSDDSDIDQDDNVPLEKSTLFWTNQKILSIGLDEITLAQPTAERIAATPRLAGKLFIIILIIRSNKNLI